MLTLRDTRVDHLGLVHLDSVILQVEVYGAASDTEVLSLALLHGLLEVGIEPQNLQQRKRLVWRVFMCTVSLQLTCLSKATHAGFSPPTPFGNTLQFFLVDWPGIGFPPTDREKGKKRRREGRKNYSSFLSRAVNGWHTRSSLNLKL